VSRHGVGVGLIFVLNRIAHAVLYSVGYAIPHIHPFPDLAISVWGTINFVVTVYMFFRDMWGYATGREIKIRRRALGGDNGNGCTRRWNIIDNSILALFLEGIIVPCICVTVSKNDARIPLPAARGLHIP
jgi:hypothetical protein